MAEAQESGPKGTATEAPGAAVRVIGKNAKTTTTTGGRNALARGRTRQDLRPCLTCNEKGHFDSHCPTFKTLRRMFPALNRCYNKCFGTGHKTSQCPAEKGIVWSVVQGEGNLRDYIIRQIGEQSRELHSGSRQESDARDRAGDGATRPRMHLRQGPAVVNERDWVREEDTGQKERRYQPRMAATTEPVIPRGSPEFSLDAWALLDLDFNGPEQTCPGVFDSCAFASQDRVAQQLEHANDYSEMALRNTLRGRVGSAVTICNLVGDMRQIAVLPSQGEFKPNADRAPSGTLR